MYIHSESLAGEAPCNRGPPASRAPRGAFLKIEIANKHYEHTQTNKQTINTLSSISTANSYTCTRIV